MRFTLLTYGVLYVQVNYITVKAAAMVEVVVVVVSSRMVIVTVVDRNDSGGVIGFVAKISSDFSLLYRVYRWIFIMHVTSRET